MLAVWGTVACSGHSQVGVNSKPYLDHVILRLYSHYAAVAADTFSSELGILSESKPRLITSWNLRQVPPGTNGGVTLLGTLAGLLGALTMALTSAILLPFCTPRNTSSATYMAALSGLSGGTTWGWREISSWIVIMTLWGGVGSLLDSFLGGWLQASVIDVRTGKLIEGSGGQKVCLCRSANPSDRTAKHWVY